MLTQSQKSSNFSLEPFSDTLQASEFERLWSSFCFRYVPLAQKLAGEDAEDAIATVALIVTQKWQSGDYLHRSESAFMGYCQQVLRNVCARQHAARRKQPVALESEPLTPLWSEPHTPLWQDEEDVEGLESLFARGQQDFLECLAEAAPLTQNQRIVFLLHLAGVKSTTIAQLMQVSIACVHQHRRNALAVLRGTLVPSLSSYLAQTPSHRFAGRVQMLWGEMRQQTPSEFHSCLPSTPQWLSRRMIEQQGMIRSAGMGFRFWRTREGAMVSLWQSTQEEVL